MTSPRFPLAERIMLVPSRTEGYHSPTELEEDSALRPVARDHGSSPPDQSLFWSMLQDSAREALRSALGDAILGILTDQKVLDNPANVSEFAERLRTLFGASAAKTLQFVITKELYRRLNLSFEPDGSFDYTIFLQNARRAFLFKRGHHD